jgi:hypothetical protein
VVCAPWRQRTKTSLPNGRRADILALLPDGGFVILEVKSCARDFLSDTKWPEYRDYCDRLYFAIDLEFPQEMLPAAAGLVVAEDREAVLLREAPDHLLAPARRRALLLRFARLAAGRVDPPGDCHTKRFLEIADDNPSALAGIELGLRFAQSARAPGNERCLAVKPAAHRTLSLCCVWRIVDHTY